MDFDKVIESRKSVRKFSTKKPDWRDIIECINAARYAPMAGNNYTLKFIIVNNKEKIKKIADCCQQPFVGTTDYVVVACTDSKRTKNAYGQFAEKFCRQQAGAAIQNFLLKIVEKGLASCMVGYFAEDIIKNELKIPENITIEAILPIGYESKAKGGKTKKRLKIDINRILYFNKYGNKKMKTSKIDPY